MNKKRLNNDLMSTENDDLKYKLLFYMLILSVVYSLMDTIFATIKFQPLYFVMNSSLFSSYLLLFVVLHCKWIKKIVVISFLLFVIFMGQFILKSLMIQSVSTTLIFIITFIMLYLLFWKQSFMLLMLAIFIFFGILAFQIFNVGIQINSSFYFFNLLVFNCGVLALFYWRYRQELKSLKIMLEQKELILNENVKELNEKNEKIELLYHEIQHRIKNNLQVISSLIGLQIHQIEDKNSKEAFYDTKSRIDVMSLLHQELHIEDHSTLIDLKEFITKITHLIQSLYSLQPNSISIDFNMEQKFIPFEQANSIGLIINELITNSVKYAKPISNQLKISILFSNLKESTIEKLLIVYSDNGTKKIDFYNHENNNLGVKLVRSLINQSKATVNIETENLNLYTFKFPL